MENPFKPTPVLQTLLSAYNEKWAICFAQFEKFSELIWSENYHPTTIERIEWERYLPVTLYMEDLYHLSKAIVPEASIPLVIHQHKFRSIVDLWHILPANFQGAFTLDTENLERLLLALSSPAKFGTRLNRYPQQLNWLKENASLIPDQLSVIDYACGTGQGTYEIAELLKCLGKTASVTGLTIEVLDLWMAENKSVPHLDMYEEYTYTDTDCEPQFMCGDINSYSSKLHFQLILCNGLIGGPFLNQDEDYLQLWKKINEQTEKNSLFITGHSFHGAYNPERFIDYMPTNFQILVHEKETVIYQKDA